jgi:hypothetical protein
MKMINLDFLVVVKVSLLLGQVVYAVFAYLIVRQISLMNQTFKTSLGPIFSLLGYIHFYAVLGLMVLTLILL